MKVLQVCSYYITSKLYKNLVESLERRGLYNDIYIPVHSNDLIDKYKGIENEKTRYIYSNCFNKIDRISFRLKNRKIYSDLNKKIDFESIDIIHAHSLFVNGYLAYKIKKDKNINYVVAVRNTDVNTFLKKMIHLRKIGVEIMINAKQIVFVSPKYRDSVIEKYIPDNLKEEIKSKSIVIPNGIDEFWFDNLNMGYKEINKNNLKLLYVGKLDRNKNIYTSMNVVKKLNNMGYKATLDIVGDGPEFKNIKKISKVDYNGKIILHGYMDRERIIKLYRNSDIFVMPSKYETFGLVYIEAISQGLPVIYTKGQGFDGYFDEGRVGYSVRYNDVDEIARRIINIVEKSPWDLRYIKEDLKTSFNWSNIASTYNEIYEKIKQDESNLRF